MMRTSGRHESLSFPSKLRPKHHRNSSLSFHVRAAYTYSCELYKTIERTFLEQNVRTFAEVLGTSDDFEFYHHAITAVGFRLYMRNVKWLCVLLRSMVDVAKLGVSDDRWHKLYGFFVYNDHRTRFAFLQPILEHVSVEPVAYQERQLSYTRALHELLNARVKVTIRASLAASRICVSVASLDS